VRSRTAAALARVAAICGLLAAPLVATAQSVRCPDDGSAPQIRRVTFEGNQSFTGRELSLHVVATPSDFTARFLGKKAIAYGAVLGLGAGLYFHGEEIWKSALIGTAVGAGAGVIIGSANGVERCLLPRTLNSDISSIRGFYGDRGFPETRVDTATNVDGGWVDVTYRITEGAPVLIESARISEDSALTDLMPRLNSRVGERYSLPLLQADIDSIETRLQNIGYPEAKALRNINFPTPRTAAVELTIERGPRARIGKIDIIRNGVEGRAGVIDSMTIRELLLFNEGDLYSAKALFDSERRFYRISTFLSAEVAPLRNHVYEDSLVDVKVNVVEDLTHKFDIEPGYGTLDCLRARTEYSDRAVRGRLNRIDLSASVSKIGRARGVDFLSDFCRLQQDSVPDISSEQVNYNATIRYSRPTPLRGGLLPSVSAYTERRGGYQAYMRTTLFGAALNLSKNITRTIAWNGSYTFEYGSTRADSTVLCFVFQACDGTSIRQLTDRNRGAVIGMRFARDQRNFADSASRGSFSRLELRAADPVVSDPGLLFQKAVGDVGLYRAALGGVVVARLRGGIISGNQAPPQERLYAGGENSVRGFSQNELGSLIYVTQPGADTAAVTELKGTSVTTERREELLQSLALRTIPTGGNGMAVANLEYRWNVPFVRSLQAIGFVDVGALWTEKRATETEGEKQARWTPGIAVKWFSPIGAVQFNFAYNEYNDPKGPVYLNTGPGSSLTCLSGTFHVDGPPAQDICLAANAKAPKSSFWKKLTFTIAFPPDF
jgi:outer membrane protein assembly factor BamA